MRPRLERSYRSLARANRLALGWSRGFVVQQSSIFCQRLTLSLVACRTPAPPDHRSGRRQFRDAFTLIELLVVVAVIALLISILLPALSAARRASQQVVCLSNMRHVGLGAILYAQDNGDQVWPVNVDGGVSIPPIGGAWARLPGAEEGTVRPGYLYDYVSNVDQIAECPMNRRSTLRDDNGKNMFGGDTALDFDYTMVANTQGARLDRHTRMGHITRPELYPIWNLPPLVPPAGLSVRHLSGLAIFVEERTQYFNERYPDGLWSNGDQIETRHKGGGHVAYLEGHANLFKPIMGAVDRVHERKDLDANDFYVRVASRWVRLELRAGELHPYGWINNPERSLPP